MEAEGWQYIYGLNDRMLLWVIAALLFVLALVILLVLISEVSRLRFMEYNERLARTIWEDKQDLKEVEWPLERGKVFPAASCKFEDCGAAGSRS